MSEKAGFYGPTSFSELEELVQAREEAERIMSVGAAFSMLSDNIIMDGEIEDKATALSNLVAEYSERINESVTKEESGGEPNGGEPLDSSVWSEFVAWFKASPKKSEKDGDHPASHYLVVEDPQKTSTWHLRVKNMSGEPDHNLMGAAWAEMNGGYRGNKLDRSAALSKLKNLYEQEGMETPDKKSTGFTIVKNSGGNWIWFARYSNKYLDDDFPREIISEESHINFVKEVKEGKQDYPELWLHHIKGTTWGEATWVGYDSGFALAAGYIYPEYKDLAEALSKQSSLLLSHGMDSESIVRDKENPNIILRHATKEISPLPAHRAANKLTGFIVLEEDNNMEQKGFSSEDRQNLIDMGVPEATVDKLAAANEAISKVADQVLPSKEAAEQPREEEDIEVQAAEEEPAAEEETAVEQEEAGVDEELVDALVESIKSLSDKVEAIANHVKALEETQEKMVGESTKATRMSILKSVIGSEEARIDGRSSLAKSGPTETEPNGGGFFWRKEGWTNGN